MDGSVRRRLDELRERLHSASVDAAVDRILTVHRTDLSRER